MSKTCGLVTVQDIITELGSLGHDIRITGDEEFTFDPSVHELSNLTEGMIPRAS